MGLVGAVELRKELDVDYLVACKAGLSEYMNFKCKGLSVLLEGYS